MAVSDRVCTMVDGGDEMTISDRAPDHDRSSEGRVQTGEQNRSGGGSGGGGDGGGGGGDGVGGGDADEISDDAVHASLLDVSALRSSLWLTPDELERAADAIAVAVSARKEKLSTLLQDVEIVKAACEIGASVDGDSALGSPDCNSGARSDAKSGGSFGGKGLSAAALLVAAPQNSKRELAKMLNHEASEVRQIEGFGILHAMGQDVSI
eukprot:603841-Pleurochrysis_carterae.AAC.1